MPGTVEEPPSHRGRLDTWRGRGLAVENRAKRKRDAGLRGPDGYVDLGHELRDHCPCSPDAARAGRDVRDRSVLVSHRRSVLVPAEGLDVEVLLGVRPIAYLDDQLVLVGPGVALGNAR